MDGWETCKYVDGYDYGVELLQIAQRISLEKELLTLSYN